MKYDITHVLPILYPGVTWSLVGNDLSGLSWPADTPRPDPAALEAKIEELQSQEAMRLLRIERNRRLSETDWITLRAYRSGQPVPAEWAVYQQALADLPNTAEPKLNDFYELDMDSVVWPTKPLNT